MSQLFTKYWYKTRAIAGACLFNLRDGDLDMGGAINCGAIVRGLCGFSVAERDVLGFSGEVVGYEPNRCIEWFGFFLTCIALDGLPMGGQIAGTCLRHKHYVVAEMTAPAALAHAKAEGLPIILSEEGRTLVNLETFSVPGRTPAYRRAKLL